MRDVSLRVLNTFLLCLTRLLPQSRTLSIYCKINVNQSKKKKNQFLPPNFIIRKESAPRRIFLSFPRTVLKMSKSTKFLFF